MLGMTGLSVDTQLCERTKTTFQWPGSRENPDPVQANTHPPTHTHT